MPKKTHNSIIEAQEVLTPIAQTPAPAAELGFTATVQAPTDPIMELIARAVNSDVPVEKLERLLEMRAKLRAEAAKEAYDRAMAGFQGECPVIKKTKSVPTDTGKIAYSYAPLESIVQQVQPILTKHGLSYFITIEVADKIKATCTAKHIMGHSESSSMQVPLGTRTRVMSEPQLVAATATFAKRYAFVHVFGIMTGDEDNERVLLEKTTGENTKNFAVKVIEDKLSSLTTPEEFDERITFLTKELELAQSGKKAPSTGLKAEQYQELILHAEKLKSKLS